MGIKVEESLDVCNFGAQMLRIAERLEAGEIDVEGEKMPLSEEFKNKLEAKYKDLKTKAEDKIKDKKEK